MGELYTCSNEKLSFKYSDKWELDEIPNQSNPDCIATLTYEDGSILNVVAFPSQMSSLAEFKEVIQLSLLDDDAEIISSEIDDINGFSSIQIHSKITIPEIIFDMFTIVFLEDEFVYIFELRTVSDIFNELIDIVKTFKILE